MPITTLPRLELVFDGGAGCHLVECSACGIAKGSAPQIGLQQDTRGIDDPAQTGLGHQCHGLIQLLHHISKVGWHLCRVLAPRGNELAGLSHTHRMWRCQGCR